MQFAFGKKMIDAVSRMVQQYIIITRIIFVFSKLSRRTMRTVLAGQRWWPIHTYLDRHWILIRIWCLFWSKSEAFINFPGYLTIETRSLLLIQCHGECALNVDCSLSASIADDDPGNLLRKSPWEDDSWSSNVNQLNSVFHWKQVGRGAVGSEEVSYECFAVLWTFSNLKTHGRSVFHWPSSRHGMNGTCWWSEFR